MEAVDVLICSVCPAFSVCPSNPVDPSGQTRKRRGLILRGLDDLEDFRRILGDDRLSTLMKMLQQVNPGKGGTDQDRDVIDI